MAESSNIQDLYPLSPMQEGILFHHLYDPSAIAYFLQTSYRIIDVLDIECVERSLNELVNRHDILRTAFIYKETEKMLQVVLKERKPEFRYIDLRQRKPDSKEQLIAEMKEMDKRRGFDLSKDTLFRACVWQLSDTEFEFSWSCHHILMDGWCMAILTGEYFEIYNSFLEMRPYILPPVKQYRDFIEWLSGQDDVAAADYWATYLKDYTQAAGIPARCARITPGANQVHSKLLFSLGEDMSRELGKLAIQLRVTLYTVLEAIWGVLLSKYNNTSDVVFGSVVSGRPGELRGIETMVGLFINTVPVRVKYESNTTMRTMITALQADALDGNKWHHYPLASIQANSFLKQQLLDHVMVFENYPVSNLKHPAVEGADVVVQEQETDLIETFEQNNYDFSVTVAKASTITMRLEYNEAVYDPDMVSRIPGHFKELATQLLEDPDTELVQMNILTAGEKEEILNVFNDTTVNYPAEASVAGLFEEQAALMPDHTILVCEDRFYSYRELNHYSNGVAHYLREQEGIQAGDVVALTMSRTEWLIAGILGILKAGAVYLVIEANQPLLRREQMLQQAGAKLILTEEQVCRSSKAGKMDNPGIPLTPDQICCLMYTSGSTGVPKSVMVSNRNIVSLVKGQELYGLTLVSTSSPAFDASLFEYWHTLLNGGRLVMMDEKQVLNTRLFRESLQRNAADICWITSGLFNQLTDTDIHIFSGLKTVITGGEKMSLAHMCRFRNSHPEIDLINAYGPTENTTFSLMYHIAPGDGSVDVPIGKPLKNRQAYILDSRQKLCPVGIAGELYVSGAGVTKGYLQQPELTAKRFVPGPTGDIMYASGDYAKWLADGNIEFLGRTDGQIKLRGYRIELSEIEQLLLTYPEIISAVAIVRGEAIGRYIVAYYTATRPIESAGPLSFLAEHLPDYMLPSFLIQLDSIPLTAVGKVNKTALPDPVAEGYGMAAVPDEAASVAEERLITIWEEILGRKGIGVTDNFFEMGGNSLDAVRVASNIYRLMDTQVELADIFENPSIRELAAVIERYTPVVFEPLPLAEPAPHYALSHAQQGIWIMDQLSKDPISYNMPVALSLDGTLNKPALHQALSSVVQRHEILRTIFVIVDGQPRQQVVPAGESGIYMEITDLRALPDRWQQLERLSADFALISFSLSQLPLLKCNLVELEEDQAVLLVTMHHIISDAWSLQIFFNDLEKYYHMHREGKEDPLSPLRIQYKDYAEWQQKQLTGENLAVHRNYWTKQLRHYVPLAPLPFYRKYIPPEKAGGDKISFALDRVTSDHIISISQKQGVTVFSIMTACFSLLLHSYTLQDTVTIGTPAANREHYQLHDQIGMYLNNLVLPVEIKKDEKFSVLLKRVQQLILNTQRHQIYPFDKIVEDLHIERQEGKHPIFSVMIDMVSINLFKGPALPVNTATAGELDITPYPFKHHRSKYDIIMNCAREDNDINICFEYDTDHYMEPDIARMGEDFLKLVVRFTANIQQRITQVYMLEQPVFEPIVPLGRI